MSLDKEYGGLVYGYSPEGNFTNDNKYFWVQAEALAASWRLYKITNNKDYYDYSSYDARRSAAHSGSDSDDFFIYID